MSNTHSEATELYTKGYTLLKLGKYEQAEKKFAEAYVKDNKMGSALWGIGISLISRGKKREGEKELEIGLAKFPDNVLFLHTLARHYLGEERYAKALEITEQWLQRQPNKADAHETYAKILLRFKPKEKEQIFSHLKTAQQLSPTDSDVLETIAEAEWELNKDKKTAEHYFKEALRFDPSQAMLHNNYGVFLLNTGNAHGALKEFRTAVQLDPSIELSVNNMGIALASTHPVLAWTYKTGQFFRHFPILSKLNGVALYFVIRAISILSRKGTIPMELGFAILVPYVLFTLYTFFGNKIFLYAFKKGWIT